MTPFLFSDTPYRWHYVDAQNNLVGPVSAETLDALFLEGIISLNTRVRREEGTEFQPYSSIFTASKPRNPLLWGNFFT
ncbi:MAG: GYF domain-containing protein [Chthoniobacteraceae bacterium]